MRSRDLPDIMQLTPTSYATYRQCAREFWNRHVLAVPASDFSASGDSGLLAHAMLRFIHASGNCQDRAHVRDVLAAHGSDDPYMRGVVERHASRCPREADADAHEVDRARFHRGPPMFMATARIDAIWLHDGLLDARDYKTGSKWHDRLIEDPCARVQAWILQRDAIRKGLRLRLRYEYLSPEVDDDPEPWEPDRDDLDAVERELRDAVAHMRTAENWTGVADESLCRRCSFRSICRDSAARGAPSWPVLIGSGEAEDR
jgi:PD-(D/E)XK nuclease superfamily protein